MSSNTALLKGFAPAGASLPRGERRKPRRVLPGLGLTMGYTLVYLSLLVRIPLSAVFLKTAGMGWEHFWDVVIAPRVVASYKLSFGASLLAASINAVFGLMLA